ncbi:MAG: hypothetical protein IT340_07470 [Chloroflexi bacterium]|nr:hypothetical protein [Chloroflexota bacterium]
MAFVPSAHLALTIDGVGYQIAADPARPTEPLALGGMESTVYQLSLVTGGVDSPPPLALKVFDPARRPAGLAALAATLAALAATPGLRVARRTVIDAQRHFLVLRRTPELIDSVAMPWIAGPTWASVVQARHPLTAAQSAGLARALAMALVALEQRGMAHSDVSGTNILLPGLSDPTSSPDAATPAAGAPLELIDLEGAYLPDAAPPPRLPTGTPGYGHDLSQHGLWQPNMDRFAGAVLLVEILGWADPTVRELAAGASYFDVRDMQQEGQRYRVLRDALAARGERLAWLFRRTWESATLEECPPLSDWLPHLPDEAATERLIAATPAAPGSRAPASPRAPVGYRAPVGPRAPATAGSPPEPPTPVEPRAPVEPPTPVHTVAATSEAVPPPDLLAPEAHLAQASAPATEPTMAAEAIGATEPAPNVPGVTPLAVPTSTIIPADMAAPTVSAAAPAGAGQLVPPPLPPLPPVMMAPPLANSPLMSPAATAPVPVEPGGAAATAGPPVSALEQPDVADAPALLTGMSPPPSGETSELSPSSSVGGAAALVGGAAAGVAPPSTTAVPRSRAPVGPRPPAARVPAPEPSPAESAPVEPTPADSPSTQFTPSTPSTPPAETPPAVLPQVVEDWSEDAPPDEPAADAALVLSALAQRLAARGDTAAAAAAERRARALVPAGGALARSLAERQRD